MESWCPSEEELLHLNLVCPYLKSMKLLMTDSDLFEMAKVIEETCDWDIGQLEIHHINTDYVSQGINRLCVTFSHCLVSLKLTILDKMSWHSIQVIGRYCQELKLFHLDIWDKIIAYDDEPNEMKFMKLEDLKIKCEDYTEPLQAFVVKYFLKNRESSLKMVQIIAHLSWLTDESFSQLWSEKNLEK